MSEASGTGRAGRYQRSTSGLLGAMLLLLLVIVGFVLFRGAVRDTPEYEPEPIDYLALVSTVQRAGTSPAYPAELPAGWFVKDAEFTPGDRPALDLAMTTAGERFAGLHQEDRSVDELVATFVGGDATEGDEVRFDGTVAPVWQTFSDPDGDSAFAAEVGDDTVLVYGSAPEDELRQLVESLTTARVEPGAAAASAS